MHAQKFFLLQREDAWHPRGGGDDPEDIKPEPDDYYMEDDEDPSYDPHKFLDEGLDDDFFDDDEEEDMEYKPDKKSLRRGPGRPKGSANKPRSGPWPRGAPRGRRIKREKVPQNCPKCEETGDSLHWLARHVNVEHGPNDGKYSCHMCETVQAQFRYLERHMEKEHFNTRYPCTDCPKILGDKNSLQKHITTVHKADRERRFQCDECEFSTHAMKYLKGHKFNCHMKDKHNFACDQCDKRFPYAFNLKQHKETTHMGLKNAVCDTCGKGFPTKGALRVHTKNGCKKLKPNVPVNCPTCNEEFTADLYMYHHYRAVHGGIPPNKKDKEQFICDQCPSVFFSKLALKFHFRKKHAGPVPLPTTTVQRWNCPHCEKVYNTRKAYDEHVKVKHEGYTPFRCTECPREFGTQLKLKSHFKLVHQRVKCDLCHKEIPNKFLMQQHKWTAHGIRPENAYECDQCSLLFTKEINYAKHMLKKHPGQPSLPLQQHHPSLVQH